MSVVCKQTLVLNECDKFGSAGFFEANNKRGKSACAFLNYSFNGQTASVRLTFTEKLDFLNAALCFKACGKIRLFFIEDPTDKQSSFDFSFIYENQSKSYSEQKKSASESEKTSETNADFNKETIAALVFLDAEPTFFACRAPSSARTEICERAVFKELNEFYEKNNKKDDCRLDVQKAHVFCQEEVESKANDFSVGPRAPSAIASGDFRQATRKNDYTEAIAYNDEAIATENYFKKEYSIKKPLAAAVRAKIPLYAPELFGGEGKEEKNALSPGENANVDDCGYSAQPQKEVEYAACGVAGGDNCGAKPFFYQKIKQELHSLFESNPAEDRLNELVPESRWARVCYEKNKYYAVGVVSCNGCPRYIVYGVEGNRLNPPSDISSRAIFLPASLFERENRGYWCMLQNAETGKTEGEFNYR